MPSRSFKKALELDPNYKEVHFQLHELYARLGNKAESQQHLQIFERLTREDQNRDREILQQTREALAVDHWGANSRPMTP